MSTHFPPGTWCWMDHQSRNRDVAEVFYTEVLPWNARRQDVGGGFEYSMLDVAGNAVGGMWQQGDEVPADAPSRWQMHLATDDLDATCERVVMLGGTVVMEPHDVMGLGHMALVLDPTGAVTGFWQAATFPGFGVTAAVGSLAWCDLRTTDVDAARDFYCGLVGWTAEEIGGGPDMRYVVFNLNGEPVAGLGPDQRPTGWTPYIAVLDVDAVIAESVVRGADLVFGPEDTPYGRLAALVDPAGVPFNLIRPNRDPIEATPAG